MRVDPKAIAKDVCRKRRYDPRDAATKAHRRAGWRVRPYRCDRCHGWHVTNGDKPYEGRRS